MDKEPVNSGLSATAQQGQWRLQHCKAYSTSDNYVGTWTKVSLNNTDNNDQGVVDAASKSFVAPVDVCHLLWMTLLHTVNASALAGMRRRLVRNGTIAIRGSRGECSAPHVSLPRTGSRPWCR